MSTRSAVESSSHISATHRSASGNGSPGGSGECDRLLTFGADLNGLPSPSPTIILVAINPHGIQHQRRDSLPWVFPHRWRSDCLDRHGLTTKAPTARPVTRSKRGSYGKMSTLFMPLTKDSTRASAATALTVRLTRDPAM